MGIFKSVLEASGMEDEGDTPDGHLTVRLNTCLGACAHAPVIALDHHLIGRVNPESAAKEVANVLNQEGHDK